MTTYDLLKTIDAERLSLLVRVGIITPEWRRAVRIYEYFMDCCQCTGKMEAYDMTGEKFCMSDENVRKIVRRLQVAV